MPSVHSQPLFSDIASSDDINRLFDEAEHSGYESIAPAELQNRLGELTDNERLEVLCGWIKNIDQAIELEKAARDVHVRASQVHVANTHRLEESKADYRAMLQTMLERLPETKWSGNRFRSHLGHSGRLVGLVYCSAVKHQGAHVQDQDCDEPRLAEDEISAALLRHRTEFDGEAAKDAYAEWKAAGSNPSNLPAGTTEVRSTYPVIVAKAPKKA